MGADVLPVAVDSSVSLDDVGGLSHHIDGLKEMVFFPLLYPDFFTSFNLTPPRGVLLCGPPGTGKTLLVRALAGAASRAGRPIAFFMRRGADVLSKWVGESERQLRALFQAAEHHAPSIIFFDEIDGLAPVRSSRQEQIHNSIVATLLALMDGLTSRGSVVVIGATNRPDAVDPALRRPGRFDREFFFSLPDVRARESILRIHTRKWANPPSDLLLRDLADRTAGHCGADLRALCSEAALHAFRSACPAAYRTDDLTSASSVAATAASLRVREGDFMAALREIKPASRRSVTTAAAPLSNALRPLLQGQLDRLIAEAGRLFPLPGRHGEQRKMGEGGVLPASRHIAGGEAAGRSDATTDLSPAVDPEGVGGGGVKGVPVAAAASRNERGVEDRSAGDTMAGGQNAEANTRGGNQLSGDRGIVSTAQDGVLLQRLLRSAGVQGARMLLCGPAKCGQAQLAYALLHRMDHISLHSLSLPSLLSDPSSRSTEEAIVRAIAAARRADRAVLFLPYVDQWWRSASPLQRSLLLTMLSDLPSSLPILLLAFADCPPASLPLPLMRLFALHTLEVRHPTAEQRRAFFLPVILEAQRTVAVAAVAAANQAASAAVPVCGDAAAQGVASAAQPSSSLPKGRGGEQLPNTGTTGEVAAVETAAHDSPHPNGIGERGNKNNSTEGGSDRLGPSLESSELLRGRERERERERERQAADDAAAEHAFRRLRMCLRDVCYRVLRERRFEAFHFPMEVEEEEEYVAVVHQPMDMATLLQRVDARCYLCLEWFVEDLDLIPANVKAFFGADYGNARLYSTACHLRDSVSTMLNQIDPDLISTCRQLAAARPRPPAPELLAGPHMNLAAKASKGKGRQGGGNRGASGGGNRNKDAGRGLAGEAVTPAQQNDGGGKQVSRQGMEGTPEERRAGRVRVNGSVEMGREDAGRRGVGEESGRMTRVSSRLRGETVEVDLHRSPERKRLGQRKRERERGRTEERSDSEGEQGSEVNEVTNRKVHGAVEGEGIVIEERGVLEERGVEPNGSDKVVKRLRLQNGCGGEGSEVLRSGLEVLAAAGLQESSQGRIEVKSTSDEGGERGEPKGSESRKQDEILVPMDTIDKVDDALEVNGVEAEVEVMGKEPISTRHEVSIEQCISGAEGGENTPLVDLEIVSGGGGGRNSSGEEKREDGVVAEEGGADNRKDEGAIDASTNGVAVGFEVMSDESPQDTVEADVTVSHQRVLDNEHADRNDKNASDQIMHGGHVEVAASTEKLPGHMEGEQATNGPVLDSSEDLTQQPNKSSIVSSKDICEGEGGTVQLSEEGKRSLEVIVSKTKDRTVAELETVHQRMHRVIVSMIHYTKLDSILLSLECATAVQ